MYSSASFFRPAVATALAFCLSWANCIDAQAGESVGAASVEQGKIDRAYDRLIEHERARKNPENLAERLASGIAALGIGLYGYYNDDRGVLTKVVYSATQTAGVVLVSNAILDSNQPSLLLLTDRYLHHRQQMDLTKFKRGIVLIEEKRALGEAKQLAYTSAILCGIYAYDGYRAKGSEEGLRNVFYFLSFNFALISAANFYRLFSQESVRDTGSAHGSGGVHVHLAVLPTPTLTLTF